MVITSPRRSAIGMMGIAFVGTCFASEFQFLPTTDTVFFGGTCMPAMIHWTVCSSDSFDTVRITTDTTNHIYANGGMPKSVCFVGPKHDGASYRLMGSAGAFHKDSIPIDSLYSLDYFWTTLALTIHYIDGTTDSAEQTIKCFGGLKVARHSIKDTRLQPISARYFRKQRLIFSVDGRTGVRKQPFAGRTIPHCLYWSQ
jgi:hypothetical protein